MTQFELEAGRKLIVALDMPDAGEAYEFWQRLALPEAVAKIGLELLFSGGVELAQKLAAQGVRVFVDAKLFDIGNTVEQATARVAALGAAFLTVHAQDAQTVAAAVRGRGRSDLKLLGITLLTSTAPESLGAQGISLSPAELVLRRARIAAEAGFDGAVSSPWEARDLKASFGEKFAVVCPESGPEPASGCRRRSGAHGKPRRGASCGRGLHCSGPADYAGVRSSRSRPRDRGRNGGCACRRRIKEFALPDSAKLFSFF